MRGLGGTVAALGAALLIGVGPVAAQQGPPMRTSIGDAAADRRPVVINADQLVYDRERATVTARGNVVIFQGDRVVLADEVVFDQRANRVTATGNVSLTEPGAPAIFAARAELTRDMKDGVMEQFRMLFPDDSKMAANGAIRGTVTARRRPLPGTGRFSPCSFSPSLAWWAGWRRSRGWWIPLPLSAPVSCPPPSALTVTTRRGFITDSRLHRALWSSDRLAARPSGPPASTSSRGKRPSTSG